MKKIFLCLSIALLTNVTFGQIAKGTKFISGSFDYSTSKDESSGGGMTFVHEELSSFSIMPSFGYMLTDRIGAGLRATYQNSKQTFPDRDVIDQMNNLVSGEIEQVRSIITVGLFGRYYVPVAGDKLFFRLDLGFDLGFGTTSFNVTPDGGSTIENDGDISTLNVGFEPGFDYFIGDKWALQLNWGSIGYQSEILSTDGGNENEVSGFGAEFDFSSLRLGASWFF